MFNFNWKYSRCIMYLFCLCVFSLFGNKVELNAAAPMDAEQHGSLKSKITKQRKRGLYEELLKVREVEFDGTRTKLKPLSIKFEPETEILSLEFQKEGSADALRSAVFCRTNSQGEFHVGILDAKSRFVAFLKVASPAQDDDLFLWLLAWYHLNQAQYTKASEVYGHLTSRRMLADPLLEKATEWYFYINSEDFKPEND